MQILDLKRMIENLGGDGELISQVIVLFFEQKEVALERIRNAIEKENYKDLAIAAHSIKGMLGNFFADYAVESAMRLEKMAQARNLRDALVEFDCLNNEIEKLASALNTETKFINMKGK